MGRQIRESAATLLGYGIAMFDKGNVKGALTVFKMAKERNPKQIGVAKYIGYSLMIFEKFPAAIKELEIACRQEPSNTAVFSNLAFALELNKDDVKAVDILTKAIEREPRDLHCRALLAGIYAKLGNSKDAEAEYLEILELEPRDAQSLLHLGNLYYADRKLKIAAGHFRLIGERKTKCTTLCRIIALENLEKIYLELGYHGRRRQTLGRLMKISPNDPRFTPINTLPF